MKLVDLQAHHRPALVRILESAQNLHDDERAVALELIDEGLQAPERTSYRFFVAMNDADDAANATDDAAAEGTVLGYLCCGRTPMTARTVDLYWIVVDQNLQGKGVGRVLLAGLEGAMRGADLLTIRVETASSEAYDGTIAFYQRTGFEERGRIRDFYDTGDDLIIFTRRVETTA